MAIIKLIGIFWIILDLIGLSLIFLRPDKIAILNDFKRWFKELSLYSIGMGIVLLILLPFTIIPSLINIKNK
jgi:sterol desaturase/sphingolipid hydroxylase (fatty acid hydroxylase superfamily)